MSFNSRTRTGRPDAEPAPPLTAAVLERSALWHLGRRALTTPELRQALEKKASRHPAHPEAPAWIEALVTRFTSSQVLDDPRTARDRIEIGRGRGWSKRRIEQKLRGVDADVKTEAFSAVQAESGAESAAAAELAAAMIFVEKKRLGAKDPQKALGALARQGFSYAVAKAALSGNA